MRILTSVLLSFMCCIQLRSALGAESMGSGTGIAIACFLAQEGATLTIKNRRGKTAFDLCSDSTAQDMVRQYSRTKRCGE